MNWVNSYYEALEFFYFEPQHIRRRQLNPDDQKVLEKAKRSSNFDTVKKHLREMEVTLNHNISQFFHLAPASFRNTLFGAAFNRPIEGEFDLHGREAQDYFGNENVMQPDLVFTSEASVASIEMKVKSKSSIDQVQKYALLGWMLEKRDQGKKKQHNLLLLGRGTLAAQFKDRFGTIDAVKAKTLEQDIVSGFVSKKRKWLKNPEDEGRFRDILKDMKLAFWSYTNFSDFLQASRPPDGDQSLGAEVCRNLFDGLRDEFAVRKLL